MKNKNSRYSPNKETIAERLKRLRLEAGLTGSRLAELTGSKQSRISDIENGKGYLYADELPVYASALNTTVSYLVTGIEPPNQTVSAELGLNNHAINVLRNQDNEAVRELVNILLWDKDQTLIRWLYAFIVGDFSRIEYRSPDQGSIMLNTENLVGFPPEFQEKAMILIIMDFFKEIRNAYQNSRKAEQENE